MLVRIYNSIEYQGYAMYLSQDFEGQGRRLVKPIALELDKPLEIGAAFVPPSHVWDEGEAQQLMQELWNAGLRPNNGEGSSAQVEALKENLTDLRYLLKIKR